MLNNNKVTLFLIAVVFGLTTYYVNLDSSSTTDTFEYEYEYSYSDELIAQRKNIQSYRDQEVSAIRASINTADTYDQVLSYYDEIQAINDLTTMEITYETVLEENGYEYTLVYISDDTIVVTVAYVEESLSAANDIMNIVYDCEGVDISSEIVVNFLESEN